MTRKSTRRGGEKPATAAPSATAKEPPAEQELYPTLVRSGRITFDIVDGEDGVTNMNASTTLFLKAEDDMLHICGEERCEDGFRLEDMHACGLGEYVMRRLEHFMDTCQAYSAREKMKDPHVYVRLYMLGQIGRKVNAHVPNRNVRHGAHCALEWILRKQLGIAMCCPHTDIAKCGPPHRFYMDLVSPFLVKTVTPSE